MLLAYSILNFFVELTLLQPNISNQNGANQSSKDGKSTIPEDAIKNGFQNEEDWVSAKKGGFDKYDDWIKARNEGFETKGEWDDWKEIKSSDLVDLASYYDTKDIKFMQNKLRKSFLVSLKLAKKGGFDSIQSWKDAQKLDIDNNSEWQIAKELQLQSDEEYQLTKEFRKKITPIITELEQNQEVSLEKIIELIANDYAYNQTKSKAKDKVYKDITKERFEDLIERTIKVVVLESDDCRYSRVSNTILRKSKLQIHPDFTPENPNDLTHFHCPNCDYMIPKTSTFCQHCGQKIESCPICKLAIENGDIGTCPTCDSKFHLPHLLELLKISGLCPICKSGMTQHDITPNKG